MHTEWPETFSLARYPLYGKVDTEKCALIFLDKKVEAQRVVAGVRGLISPAAAAIRVKRKYAAIEFLLVSRSGAFNESN